MSNLVTQNQALKLRELGFNDVVSSYMSRLSTEDKFSFSTSNVKCGNFNERWYTLSMPTTDEAIDWLRKKFNVVIANKAIPFVDPKTKKIVYGYVVKWCNLRDGWNGREIIGYSIWSADINASKRSAITLAIKWLKKRGSTATGQ